MKLPLLNSKEWVTLADRVFKQPINMPLVHQVVTRSLAASHKGMKAQKSRADARGGGRKPWRQKGTGRARTGSIRNPIWRGGGVTFAARPHITRLKLNRKMYRRALCSILSALVKDGRLGVMRDISLKNPKTKELVALLREHDFHKGCIIVDKLDENLVLASRNLADIRVVGLDGINPLLLMAAPKLVLTQAACERLQKNLSG